MKRILFLLLLSVVFFGVTASAWAAPLRLSDLADILPEWPVNASEAGGRLILSDSPEDVAQEGILYRDSVKGNVHVTGAESNALRLILSISMKGDLRIEGMCLVKDRHSYSPW